MEVTKEMVAEIFGRSAADVSDEELEAVRAEMGDNPTTPTDGSQGDAGSQSDDDPVFKRSELMAMDVLADDFPLREKLVEALKDPVRNDKHPNHQIVRDNMLAAQRALEEKALAERESDRLRGLVQDAFSQQAVLNDPQKGVFGGIDRARILSGEDIEHNETDWLLAKMRYDNLSEEQRRIEANDAGRLSQMWTKIDADASALRVKAPNAEIDEVLGKYVPVTREGKPNPNYTPMTVEDGLFVLQVRKAGGLDSYRNSLLTEARTQARAEVLQELTKKRSGGISNRDGVPIKPTALPAIPKTVDEFNALSEAQQVAISDQILGKQEQQKPFYYR